MYSNSFSFIRSNEYAEYHDTRGKMDFNRTFWTQRVEDGSIYFFIKNYNNKNNESRNYILVIKEGENNTPEIVTIKGYNKNDSPEYTQVISDVMNFLMIYARNEYILDQIDLLEDPWENYTQIYSINKFLPIFKFDNLYVKGEKSKGGIMLKSFGILKYTKDTNFFDMLPISQNTLSKQNSSILTANDQIAKELYDFSIILDDNWDANSDLGFPGYWISKHSVRDSQIMLEKSPWDKFQEMGYKTIEDFISRSLLVENERIIAETLKIIKNENKYIASYYLIENKTKNYTRREYWIDDGTFYILNFSSFSDIYDANIDYYENIINSIK